MVILEDDQANALQLLLKRVNIVGEEANTWMVLYNALSQRISKNEAKKSLSQPETGKTYSRDAEANLQEPKTKE